MEYRIVYGNGKCQNYANSRKDLLEWFSILKDEVITDIQKIYKNGQSESVFGKYRKYLKQNSPAQPPTKANVQDYNK